MYNICVKNTHMTPIAVEMWYTIGHTEYQECICFILKQGHMYKSRYHLELLEVFLSLFQEIPRVIQAYLSSLYEAECSAVIGVYFNIS
jgi:hypothetical protein